MLGDHLWATGVEHERMKVHRNKKCCKTLGSYGLAPHDQSETAVAFIVKGQVQVLSFSIVP